MPTVRRSSPSPMPPTRGRLACLALGIGLGLFAASPASAQQPPPERPSNDDFAAATVLSGDEVTRPTDSNIGATKQSGEPQHAGLAGGSSVWYRWESPQSRPVIVDSFGSSFDTTLAVYRGASVEELTEVRSNDDSGSPRGSFQSELRFDATAGQTYWIAIDGYVSPEGEVEQGTASLSLRQLPPPPETVIETGPQGTVPSGETSAEFTFSGAPTAGAYECRIDSNDDGDWDSCASPYALSGLAQGEHLLEVRGRNSGGVDATPATREWIIGAPLPPPNSTIYSAPPSEVDSTQRTATFAFGADGRTRGFECRLDGAAWARCTSPLTVTGLSFGQHRFEVRALAPSGVPEDSPAVHEWTIDFPPPPETTITAGPPSETAQRSAEIAFAADSAVERYECRLDTSSDAAWQTCATPHPLSGLATGAHRFEVRAVGAGGPDPSPATVEWTVLPRSSPDTTITDGPAGTVSDTDARFEFTGSGEVDGFECRIDSAANADWRACESPRDFHGLADGEHTVEVRAVNPDAADATPATRTWTVDTRPALPDTTITAGPDALTQRSDANFEFTASGAADRFECRLDSAAWFDCASPHSETSLGLGEHRFDVRAVNSRGADPTPASTAWTIESSSPVDPPETSIDSGPASVTTSNSARFLFSATGAAEAFDCSLDGGAWSACTSPHEIAAVGLGDHTLEVRATGPGGADASPDSFSWTVTVAPGDRPQTKITKAPKRVVTKSGRASVKISFESPTAGIADFQCKLDSGAWAACASPRSSNVAASTKPRKHTLQVRAVGAAGQTDLTPAKAGFIVQKQKRKKHRGH